MSDEPVPPGRSRRAVAVLVDEATSSVQNYVVLFAALHLLALPDLGRFTLAYTAVTLLEIVLKAFVLTSLNVDFAAADERSRRRAGAYAAGATVLAGLAACAVLAVAGLLVGGGDRNLLCATGLAALALVTQESWRSYFFTAATPWRAVGNDVVCLAVTVVLVWAAAAADIADTPAALVLLLAAGTGAGFFIGIVQTRILPSLPGGIGWLRRCSALGWRVAGARGAAQLAGRLSLTVIGAISGAAALGRLGAARTLIAPATTLVTSMASYSLPEASRLRRRDDPRFTRFLVANSVGLAGLVLLVGLVLAVLPDSLGRLLAGDNLGVARRLLLPVVLFSTANALQQGARIGMITLDRAGLSLRIAITTGAGVVLAAACGAAIDGASGAAWALALVQGVQIVTWWTAFAQAASGRPRRRVWFGSSRAV